MESSCLVAFLGGLVRENVVHLVARGGRQLGAKLLAKSLTILFAERLGQLLNRAFIVAGFWSHCKNRILCLSDPTLGLSKLI